MRIRSGYNRPGGQLRWVILLLGIAVILPTVCLLWFMGQAVKNERLAVRQKLVNSYSKRAKTFFVAYSDTYWGQARERLGRSEDVMSESPWRLDEVFAEERFGGFVIYDSNEAIVWPIVDRGEVSELEPDEIFRHAFELEFEEDEPAEALDEYERIRVDANDPAIEFLADMAAVRCLNKSQQTDKAVELCRKLAYPATEEIEKLAAGKILQARVMLADLYRKANSGELLSHLRRTLGKRQYDDEEGQAVMAFPSEAHVWALDKLITVARESGLAEQLQDEIEQAERVIGIEQVSLMGAEASGRAGGFRWLESEAPLYGIRWELDDKQVLGLVRADELSEFWQRAVDDIDDDMVFCRVFDEAERVVAGMIVLNRGQVSLGERFLACEAGKLFPGWRVELYFRYGIFSGAADRQSFVYLWTAVLVIGLMIVVSALVTKAMLRQARVNRLKNDFIATVTHELKTPLSSMRVLVDTLLDGNYNDQRQATEYLHLISKENVRLSRLIDNFLTFSRMERNKQAFEAAAVSAGAIGADAADAVQTKFAKGHCSFDVDISDNLPEIFADHDAMVTVLVNLLDNAYKYSGDDKRIKLRVFEEDKFVCFSVSDNGIGIGRRAMKRIFDRFYQVDQSLSRRAEGCGLGLSIVKFIVDAHKGTVTVESKPGEGSTFTVRMNRID